MMYTFWNPYLHLSEKMKLAFGIASVLGVLGIWSLASALDWVAPNKLPSPLAVGHALSYLSYYEGKSLLLVATTYSLMRVVVAGVIVVAVGVPLGFLMGASPKINAVLSPLIDPFRSAPVVAFLPLFVMWLGIDESMKIAFLVTGAIVYLIPMTRDALRAVPQEYWVVARDMGATSWECSLKTTLPLALPRIADAIIVSVSLMWTYITVAEYVNAKEGLGQLIQNAKRFSAMDQVFAGILVIVVLALITFTVMTRIRTHLFKWETSL